VSVTGRTGTRTAPTRDQRIGMGVIAGLVLLLPVQFAVQHTAGSEPYPALYMPAFGRVPERDGKVLVIRLTLTADSAEGPVPVDPMRLVPDRGWRADSIAGVFFADEADVRRVAADGWLDRRLREVGVVATRLRVVRERLHVEPRTRRVTRREVLAAFTVPISRGGR
jgi:hypothetical protein